MKTNKINALEAVIAALEISENELTNWFNNRGKDKTGLIPTELPLVYRRGNELTVENGLNLSRKSELWGIQLLSGVMVALTCGSGNNVSKTTWDEVKKFSEKMTFNGKPGVLPSQDVLKKHWSNKEEAKFAATVEVLEENKIEADGYRGCIWCSEVSSPLTACCFSLNSGGSGWDGKNGTGIYDRVALAFS